MRTGYVASTFPQLTKLTSTAWLQQADFVQWHKDKGIHNTAYSPLGNSNPYYTAQVWSRPEASSLHPPTEDPIMLEIAKKHNKSPHQVTYAWGITNGRSVLSKSVVDWQIVANLDADFELDAEVCWLLLMCCRCWSSANRYPPPPGYGEDRHDGQEGEV